MTKHKQLPLLALTGLILGVLAPVIFSSSANAATSIDIFCKDGTKVTVDATATLEEKQKACEAHGGYGTTPTTDYGDTTYNSVKCSDTNQVGDCAKTAFRFGNCDPSSTGVKCLIQEVITFLSIGVGIAVVGGIAFGGVTYATSQGNPSKTSKGITIIVNSVIGLVLYLLLFAITNFLVPGGVFS